MRCPRVGRFAAMTTIAASQPARASITGVVLAGGRALRMGGVDKGLVPLAGRPLVQHALARLAPQVGRTMISANRHRDAYAAFGVPVLQDAGAAGGVYRGPLAGVLAGLEQLQTDWLVCVPCDTPAFPEDLVERLAAAARAAGAPFAVAATHDAAGRLQLEPLHALVHRELRAPLAAWLEAGRAGAGEWARAQRAALASFDDTTAFANLNTAGELAAWAAGAADQSW